MLATQPIPVGSANPDATLPSAPFSPDTRPPSLREQPLTLDEQALVAANTGLAYSLVQRRYGANHPYYDDLIQAALIGLMMAARLFDPSRGCRFSTFATWRIRSKLSEYQRRRRVRLATEQAASFNDPAGPAEPVDPGAVQPLEVVIDREEFERGSDLLHSALAGLTNRERDILWRRARGETLKAISEAFGVSKERVRQIEVKALEKARVAAGATRAA